ncbi:protein shisa-4 isoform X2 [Cervus elaphus]|uniref:protein shisa-4 isoform X2 n=1 Tax=Cervus canadensis TaxID=1574408 RepID=UPI001C9E9D17|nr:protein shisa-4 isoform X2 [Cervus canadensis]XP_043779092.1 protein shisa-4 isoform X2 [Cervus elaphus]
MLERTPVRQALGSALAGEDCLWYLDRNGSWHPGFNCEFFTFCCGTCYQRYCCRDLSLLITERQQKHCLAFSPKTIAGIASAVILFVAVVATTICCFLCSCCYLYRRRQQLQSPFEGNARAGPGARATSSALHVQKTCACTQAQTWTPKPALHPHSLASCTHPAVLHPSIHSTQRDPPSTTLQLLPRTCHPSPPTLEPEEPAASLPSLRRLSLRLAPGVGRGICSPGPRPSRTLRPSGNGAPGRRNRS